MLAPVNGAKMTRDTLEAGRVNHSVGVGTGRAVEAATAGRREIGLS